MPASYPSSAKTFTTKSTGQPIASASINDLQLEVTAIENDLIAGLPATRGGTGLTSVGLVGQAPLSTGSVLAYGVQAYPADGRLTLTTGVPVTTSDVTAAGTLYYSPYVGNKIALYDGSTGWAVIAFTEISIAVPAVGNQMYDVFVYNNSGTATLELTAWTNDTTRATALTTQNGVLVKTGATTRRYVGSFRTESASQANDSYLLRHVWNQHHRVARPMRVLEATNSWTYSTASFQQANASPANQVSFVVGVAEDAVDAQVRAMVSNSATSANAIVAIGLDATNAAATGCVMSRSNPVGGANANTVSSAQLTTLPAAGYHYLAWLEYDATGSGTTTWLGDNNTPTILQSGLTAMWRS